MAETLTFAKPRPTEAWEYDQSYTKALKFYDATPGTLAPCYRFVGPTTSGTATDKPKQFSIVSGSGARPMGYLAPQIHDDRLKEYYADTGIGEEATIVVRSSEPVLIEAGTGIVDGQHAPMVEIMTDAAGKAILATGSGAVVAGHLAYTTTVNGVIYVAVLLTASGRVI